MPDVGLPQKAIPVAAVLLATAALTRLRGMRRAWMPHVAPYSIGAIAMFWVIERVSAFWS
jgi:hypothetical protein